MEINNIIASGCSICWGDELKYRRNRYVNQIAINYRANLTDCSLRGIGNETISTRLIDSILNLFKDKDFVPEEALAIVSWSFIGRLNFYNPINKKFLVLSNTTEKARHSNQLGFDPDNLLLDLYDLESYYKNHNDILYIVYNTLKHIYITQLFLETHKIKYIFTFNTRQCYRTTCLENFDPTFYKDDQNNSLPDLTNLQRQINIDNIYKIHLRNFTNDNKYSEGERGHPLDKAHVEFSKGLINFIEERYGQENH